jgi:PncC family amidohydrolase
MKRKIYYHSQSVVLPAGTVGLKKLKISFAESCTGGLLSSTITSIKGSSKVFSMGLVTYSNQAKIKILKVNNKIIKKHGAVSTQCCSSMVSNLSKISKSNICVSITGIAGPGGGSKKKPVGLVYVGIKKSNRIEVKRYLFKNKGRSYIHLLLLSHGHHNPEHKQ